METLDISKEEADGTVTLTLTGRLSIVTSPKLNDAVDQIGTDVKMLRIVLANVEYVSSAGLRVLVAAQKKMTASGGALEIVSPTADILELFDITGLKDIFTVK